MTLCLWSCDFQQAFDDSIERQKDSKRRLLDTLDVR